MSSQSLRREPIASDGRSSVGACLRAPRFRNRLDLPIRATDINEIAALKPDAVFLYNIAQSFRLSRGYDDALFFYKSYLRNAPEAENRAEVERRIAEMQLAVDQQNASAKPPNEVVAPDGSKPPAPDPAPDKPPGEAGRARPPAPAPVSPPPPDAPTAASASTGRVRAASSGRPNPPS